MTTTKKWLALYTKPRWEKKVYKTLSEKGFEVYCPLNRVSKKWSDRVKMVEEPLFKSYVFINIEDEHHSLVRMNDGVVNFVYWLGKPAVIKEEDIITIKRFLNEYEDVVAEPASITTSQQIEVTSGALMNTKGTVLSLKGKKVEVLLDFLGYKLVAYVQKKHVRILKNA